jgi:hypothetical protein
MPHPFDPQDFPLNEKRKFSPTKFFFLRGCIHFKTTAHVVDSSERPHKPWRGQFTHSFMTSLASAASDALDPPEDDPSRSPQPDYEVSSCGNMMRTIKSLVDARSGDKVADLNITFVSFGSSSVRFPKDSPHCRHEIELFAVREEDAKQGVKKHEAFIRHSIPYFWDMQDGPEAVLYKALNQERVEVARAGSPSSS